ncbi:MFS transporter [Halarchaeum sp. P4]|uniref:MFS transporter n=1 Tax=Halarchaeum sp. P4 TaxID=3421639 RepID=UPI003EBE7BC4
MFRRLRSLDVLAATALVWFLAKFLRYAFPPLFPALGARYGVTDAALGTAFTAMMLVYAALQFPSGALADRVGAARVITAGAVVAALAALALSVDVPFLVLAAGMVLVGAGTGVHKTVSVGLLSAVYPDRTGRALGVLDTVGAFGGVAAPAAVAVLLASGRFGWHALFFAAGVVGLALAALSYPRMRAREPAPAVESEDARVPLSRYAALFRDPAFAGFVAVTVCFSFTYNGVVAFLPRFLEYAGLAPATASAVYSGLFVVSLVQTVTGDLADRVGPLRVVVGTLALAALGLLALTFGGFGAAGLVAAVVVFGLGGHGFRPVRGAYLMALVPDDLAGGGLGVVRTVLMGAGALAPAVVGVLSTYADFTVAFGVLCVSALGAAGGAAVLLVAGE